MPVQRRSPRSLPSAELEPIQGVVVPAPAPRDYQALADRITNADTAASTAIGDGIWARWEFGRALLAERSGKQLPAGRLADVCAQVGKNQREVQKWMTFAEQYATEDRVRLAGRTSWRQIKAGLTKAPKAIAMAKPEADDSGAEPTPRLTDTTTTDKARASRYGKMATDTPSRPTVPLRDTGDEDQAEERRLLGPIQECLPQLQQYADRHGIGLVSALRRVLAAGFAAEGSGDEDVPAHVHHPRPRRSGRGAGW